MDQAFYRPPDPELCQGDVIDDIPHLQLKPSLEIIREVTVAGGRRYWAPYPYPPVAGKTPDAQAPGKKIILPPFHVKEGECLPVLSRFTRAIVLNYDCDLVHEEDSCLVALVRPMGGVHESDRPTIRGNMNFNHFYLPADRAFGLEEGYVDFRRVTCLDPALLEIIGTRRASLQAEAVKGLQAQFIRFVTRRDFSLQPAPRSEPTPLAPS